MRRVSARRGFLPAPDHCAAGGGRSSLRSPGGECLAYAGGHPDGRRGGDAAAVGHDARHPAAPDRGAPALDRFGEPGVAQPERIVARSAHGGRPWRRAVGQTGGSVERLRRQRAVQHVDSPRGFPGPAVLDGEYERQVVPRPVVQGGYASGALAFAPSRRERSARAQRCRDPASQALVTSYRSVEIVRLGPGSPVASLRTAGMTG